MVPTSTYIFIYGVPIFTVLFSIFLYRVVGERIFNTDDSEGSE